MSSLVETEPTNHVFDHMLSFDFGIGHQLTRLQHRLGQAGLLICTDLSLQGIASVCQQTHVPLENLVEIVEKLRREVQDCDGHNQLGRLEALILQDHVLYFVHERLHVEILQMIIYILLMVVFK